MVYYESPQATISWNEAVQIIEVRWKAFAQGEQFRTAMDKVVELAGKMNGSKVLYDNRKMSVISQEDQAWVSQNWVKRASDIQYCAVVEPEKVVAKSSLNRIVGTIEEFPYDMKFFQNMDDAVNWLAEMRYKVR
ncbi:SpoIIAA-like [Paenibacillus sophorae]|uniref:STAS/SEC14 domain-containing protein n=1 Tax=Paenibacillus sophorae TaxID=1333845 RepID=A0A1H8VP82_9BACL|nr:STAS/SEC14 domain-containing protein [Paenibacillus sophorae]QWU17595.1 STAS/SEC14 domain-containing protein [Paenibacillus sophorae]SEP17007.1 SpoIIAA-like [Paenibacillus sophorae]